MRRQALGVGRPWLPERTCRRQDPPAGEALGATWGPGTPGQLLLQVVVVVVGDGVAGGAEQQYIVGVVVLHLDGEVLPVLVCDHVFLREPAQGSAH